MFRDPELLHLLGAVSNDLTITALVLIENDSNKETSWFKNQTTLNNFEFATVILYLVANWPSDVKTYFKGCGYI